MDTDFIALKVEPQPSIQSLLDHVLSNHPMDTISGILG